MSAKNEAIAQANAELNNAGLPSYTELINLMKTSARLLAEVADSIPAVDRGRFNALRTRAVETVRQVDPAHYGS